MRIYCYRLHPKNKNNTNIHKNQQEIIPPKKLENLDKKFGF